MGIEIRFARIRRAAETRMRIRAFFCFLFIIDLQCGLPARDDNDRGAYSSPDFREYDFTGAPGDAESGKDTVLAKYQMSFL